MPTLPDPSPLQVRYEAEPPEHGAAAKALPAPRSPFLRRLLNELLHPESDLSAFALDFFPCIYRQFSAGMTREARENLLLDRASLHDLYEALRALHGARVPAPPTLADEGTALPNPYRGLLTFGIYDAPLFFGRQRKTEELRRLFEAATQPAADSGPSLPSLGKSATHRRS